MIRCPSPLLARPHFSQKTREMGHPCIHFCINRCIHVLTLLEGVAGGDGAVLEAALEPFGSLGGAAVGEGFGIDCASGHLLDAVVSDGGCGFQAGVDVAGVEQITFLGGMSPDAGEAVRLQFEAN